MIKQTRYEVLTPNGWSKFDAVIKKRSHHIMEIMTENGMMLCCTRNHMIEVPYGFESAEVLEFGDEVFTANGFSKVIKINNASSFLSNGDSVEVFDLLNVEKHNKYFTNGISSHNCEFQGSSGTLIDGATLKILAADFKVPLVDKDGLKMYKKPEAGHTYVCTVDVSRGKGLDNHAFQVLDVTSMPYEQVCTFKDSMITPLDYAEIVFRTTKSYNNAYTLVEINDIGQQVSDSLRDDFGCENLLYTKAMGRAGKIISQGYGKGGDSGLRTTKTTKAIGCNMLKLMAEQQQLIINDFDTVQELSTFSRKNQSYEAEKGSHDDLTMGLVIFGWLSDQPFFKEITEIDTLAELRERKDELMDQHMLPFGFFDDGSDEDVYEGGWQLVDGPHTQYRW